MSYITPKKGWLINRKHLMILCAIDNHKTISDIASQIHCDRTLIYSFLEILERKGHIYKVNFSDNTWSIGITRKGHELRERMLELMDEVR